MRPLDQHNLTLKHPANIMWIGAIIPLALGAGGWMLAIGAAPNVAAGHNPGAWLSGLCMAYSVPLFILPKLLKWGWEVRYFGMTAVCIGAVMLPGIVPALSLLLYSTVAPATRLAIAASYLGIHVWWGARIVRAYAAIWRDDKLRAAFYEEEDDAVYYMQQVDKKLCEKRPALAHSPAGGWFLGATIAAFATFPFAIELQHAIGLHYAYIFLLIIALPLSLMAWAMTVRACLVAFYYPGKIKQASGKTTYLDSSSRR